jgi:hypothetical protein
MGQIREKLLECNSAHAMLEKLWTCEEDSRMKALVLMWEWWGVRNKVNVGDQIRSTTEVTHIVERHLMDFRSLKLPSKPPKPPDITKWEKPQASVVKANFDGAFNKDSGSGDWGFIIRHHHGEFVVAGVGKACHLRTPCTPKL